MGSIFTYAIMKKAKWSITDSVMNRLCHPGCSELAKAKRANFRGDASEEQIDIINKANGEKLKKDKDYE